MSRKSRIAVVMELNWPYKRHYDTFAGIQEYAEAHGDWTFDLGNFPEFELARGGKFDGIVGRIGRSCLAAAKAAGVPVVNVWLDSPVGAEVPGVLADLRAAGRMVAEHLIVRGLRRLAYFGFRGSAAGKLQYEGMCEVAREHGYPCTRHTAAADFAIDVRTWKRFVGQVNQVQGGWEAPLGVAFQADELCHAVASICLAEGWRIPDELAVIGTGNEPLICTAGNPTISSIDLGDRRCGHEAARMLDGLMQGKCPPAQPLRSPPKELVVRRSTDFYAVSDPKVAQALSYMAQHSGRALSVPEIAGFAGLGRQTLERRFQQHLGRTVNEELIRQRISKMKRLLVEGGESVKELSVKAGFGTTANMFPMFKRSTGMTPKAYREKHGTAPEP